VENAALIKTVKCFPDCHEFNGSRSELETLCRRHAPVDRGDTKLIGALFANRNHLRLNINCHDAPEVRRHGNGDASWPTRKVEKDAMSGGSCGVA